MKGQSSNKDYQANQLFKYVLARNVMTIIKKMGLPDVKGLLRITNNDNRIVFQNEIKRLRNIKNQSKSQQAYEIDNEYVLLAFVNYMKTLNEMYHFDQKSKSNVSNGVGSHTSLEQQQAKGKLVQSRQYIIINKIETSLTEIQKNNNELRKFMDEEVINKDQIDYENCYDFFMAQFTSLRKGRAENIINQRTYIFQIILFFLSKIISSKGQNQKEFDYQFHEYQDQEQENSFASHYQSFNYGLVNKWKNLSSNSLFYKLIELSSICEQIPQLQAFSRTLQFSQLQNQERTLFFKLVDTIISLHKRINFLSRSQPQVVKECQQLLNEITSTNSKCQKFLFVYEQEQEGKQLLPITFGKGESKSKGYFNQSLKDLKSYISRMSEVVVSQDIANRSNFNKHKGMLYLVDLFMKVLSGDLEGIIEWNRIIENLNQSKEKKLISMEQYQVIMILEECLEIENAKMEAANNEPKSRVTRTNQELQQQINKLIEDYERLKHENRRISQNLNHYLRKSQELQIDVNERDEMIENLSMVKINLQKRIANKDDLQSKSKKQQHQTQRYLESSLLLKEQLKISQTQRQRLAALLQTERQKSNRQYQLSTRLKADKERLDAELQQLRQKMENMKVENIRQQNRLNKTINDISNEKHILETDLQTKDINHARLLERLQANQKKLGEYQRLVMSKFEERPQKPHSQSKIEQLNQKLSGRQLQLQKNKRQISSLKKDYQRLNMEQDVLIKQNNRLKQQVEELRHKQFAWEQQNFPAKSQQMEAVMIQNIRMHKKIEDLYEEIRALQSKVKTQGSSKEIKERADKFEKQAEKYRQQIAQLERLLANNQNSLKRQKGLFNQNNKHISEQQRRRQGLEAELRSRILMLESELANQKQQNLSQYQRHLQTQRTQHEQTLQKQKLIQVKLRQQTKGLEKQLQTKIEVEIKLNFEIQKLCKEINRMKVELDRYLKELTQKQHIIKEEQDKNFNHLKSIREMEARETARSQQDSFRGSPETPFKDFIKERGSSVASKKHETQEDNRSERSLSGLKNSAKYDIYFNLKEYQRLYKEYNDFKLQVASKVEGFHQMQNALNQLTNSNKILQENHQNLSQEKIRLQQLIHSQEHQLREIPVLRQKVRQLTQKNNQLINIINNGGDETGMLRREIQNLKQSLAKLQQIYNSNKADKISIEMNLSNIQNENKRLVQVNQNMKHSIKELQDKAIELNRSRNNNQAANIQSQNRLRFQIQNRLREQYQAKFKEQYNQSRVYIDQVNMLQTKLRQQTQKNAYYASENTKFESRFKQINDKNNTFQAQISRLQALLRQAAEKNNILQNQNMRLIKQVQILEQKGQNNVNNNVNLNYYLQKIVFLQDALRAVGDELTDAKEAIKISNKLNNLNGQQQTNNNQSANNHLIEQLNHEIKMMRHDIQCYKSLQRQWVNKQRTYMAELQRVNHETISLKESLNKNSNSRSIITSLNKTTTHTRNTYQNIQRRQSLNGSGATSQPNHHPYRMVELQNLLQFVYRILVYFSEVEYNSKEGSMIRQELYNISDNSSEGIFFTTLQEYTIHLLENNAIEQYKRQLRSKAQQLLAIKQNLEQLITRQIQQEQKILNRQHSNKSVRQVHTYNEYHESNMFRN